MKTGQKFIAAIVIVVLVMSVGFVGYLGMVGLLPNFPTMPSAPIVVTTTAAAPGGGGTGIYTGPVWLTVQDYWGYDESTLALTSATWKIYHADLKTFAASMTLGTAQAVIQSPADQGTLYLVEEDMTQTTGYVDPILTMSANPGILVAHQLIDVDGNGQLDHVFKIDVSKVSAPSQGYVSGGVPVNINVQSWKAEDNTGSFNIIGSALTGMTTAGDYYYNFYYAWGSGLTEGYQLNLVKVEFGATASYGSTTIIANTTTGPKFASGDIQVKSITFSGTGHDGTVYGGTWTNPTYDSSSSDFTFFRANYNGATDTTQTNFGMPFIYQRQAGASWLMGRVWFHVSSGAMTASSKYEMALVLTFLSPAAASFTEAIAVTPTG